MKLLKEFIKLIVEEEEKKSRSVAELALCIKKMSNETCYVLYDRELFTEKLSVTWIEDGDEDTELERLSMEAIKAMLTTGAVPPKDGQCYSGTMVKNSASAEPGYGQIVYRVALGLEDTLIPDRRSVTADAIAQWKKIAAGKRGNVKAMKLDNIADPKTPPPEDDCKLIAKSPEDEYLDFAYKLDSAPPETQSLIKKHNETAKFVTKQLSVQANVFEMALVVAADWLFRKSYKPS